MVLSTEKKVIHIFGDRMKECRIKLGYSAEQVAEFLHVSPATIYRYEKGDIDKLPANRLSLLAEFLCTTPAYLMGWEEESRPLEDSDILSFLSQCISDPRYEVLVRTAIKIKPEDVDQATRVLKAFNSEE